MTILGILDDSFDMRWRHKFFIPAFAALPMLGLYFVDFGVTHVVVPVPLRNYLGDMVDLGGFYYLYMAADRKSTRLNSSHSGESRMPSSA